MGIFLRDPARKLHGYAIQKETEYGAGTVYGILERFEGVGLLTCEHEHVDRTLSERTPRHFYRLTTEGRDRGTALRQLLFYGSTIDVPVPG